MPRILVLSGLRYFNLSHIKNLEVSHSAAQQGTYKIVNRLLQMWVYRLDFVADLSVGPL